MVSEDLNLGTKHTQLGKLQILFSFPLFPVPYSLTNAVHTFQPIHDIADIGLESTSTSDTGHKGIIVSWYFIWLANKRGYDRFPFMFCSSEHRLTTSGNRKVGYITNPIIFNNRNVAIFCK